MGYFDKFLKENIVTHFEESDLFSKPHFGLVPGCSTVTQLLKFLSDCVGEKVVDPIQFDFAKVFQR